MPGQIFTFSTNNFSEPFLYAWVIYIVIVDPFLITCVIRWVYIDTVYFPLILWQQGFQSKKVIPVDYHISTSCIFGNLLSVPEAESMFQHAVRDFLMMIDHLVFPYPIKRRHILAL